MLVRAFRVKYDQNYGFWGQEESLSSVGDHPVVVDAHSRIIEDHPEIIDDQP
jgi:hypothetical protein